MVMEESREQAENLIIPTDPTRLTARTPASVDLLAERRKVIFSAIFAGLLICVIWLVYGIEYFFNSEFAVYGIAPRTFPGLTGIIAAPLLHGDLNHLYSNSIPLFLLLAGSLYFYRLTALKALLWIWLITGLGVWLIGRDGSIHIGASGVVYGLASFLAVSGIIRNDFRLMSISLLTIFLYGGMAWGVLPLFPHVSWESHLIGALAGIGCAFAYRREGPQQKVYFQDEEEEASRVPEQRPVEAGPEGHSGFGNPHTTGHTQEGFSYYYLPTKKESQDDEPNA